MTVNRISKAEMLRKLAKMTVTWDDRFIALASVIAAWSKDPNTQVGCIIVDKNRRIVSTGYNGFPRGIKDDLRLWSREMKLEIILHAEVNALMYAREDLTGSTLYVWPMPPCSRCAAQIIQSGISRVVSPPASPRWKHSCDLSLELFKEAGIIYSQV